MKWDFDLVLGLINRHIIKPKIWWSMSILGEGCMNCYFLRGLGGQHVAYWRLHHHNTIETQWFLLQNGGRGEKKISLCDSSLHILGWKSQNFVQRKSNDAWCYILYLLHFYSLIVTLLSTSYVIVDEDADMEAWRFGFREMVWHWLYASTKIQIITLVKFLEIIDHSYIWTNNIV
jgi:hypothetical protein